MQRVGRQKGRKTKILDRTGGGKRGGGKWRELYPEGMKVFQTSGGVGEGGLTPGGS